MRNRYTQVVIEVMAWLAFLIFPLILVPTLQPLMPDGQLNPVLRGILLAHGILIVFYYFNFYYAIPKFYFTKNKRTYALILLSFLVTFTLVLQTNTDYNPFPSPPFRYPVFTFILSLFLRFLMITFISLGIAHMQRLKQAEQEKIRAELSYLKSQINPHFLFNTLNSIYSLTLKRSEAAPESLTKLSAIMRYAITETTAELVSLEKELNYINAYIDLEKLRLTPKVELAYTVSGDLGGKMIAPLLFIPIIENAFKFGVSTKVNSPITIAISVEKDSLRLFVKNKKVRVETTDGTAIGLENVKKRLKLLYPGDHHLKIEEGPEEFSVTLDLKLHA